MANEAKTYPRRIQALQNTVTRIKNNNGGMPTAPQARELTLQVADIIPDLWDSIKANREMKEKVDEMYPAYKIGKWLVALLASTNVLFIVTAILEHVFP